MGRCAEAAPVVVTETVNIEAAPPATATAEGTEQAAALGAPVQVKVTFPLKPVPGVTWRLYCAVWPAVTSALVLPVAPGATTAAAGAVPETGMDCGESGALSVSVRLVERTPEASGENTRVTEQEEPTATEAVQVFALILKSAALSPERATFENWSGEVPEFVTATDCGALEVPWVVEPGKVKVPGTRLTSGVGETPVPVRETV